MRGPRTPLLLLPLLLLLPSCSDDTPSGESANGGAGGGGHAHAPKMGGVLLDLDHVVQLEFVHKGDTLRIYVWDGHVEQPIRVQQASIDITLQAAGETLTISCLAQASKLTGELKGNTALFEATAKVLRGVKRLRGTLNRLKARGQLWEEVVFDLRNDEE